MRNGGTVENNRGVAYIEPGKVESRTINFPTLALADRRCHHRVSLSVVSTDTAGATSTCSPRLRQEGFIGDIHLIAAEPHMPYQRPPLSKELLPGTTDTPRIQLQSEADSNDQRVALGPSSSVVHIDRSSRDLECLSRANSGQQGTLVHRRTPDTGYCERISESRD